MFITFVAAAKIVTFKFMPMQSGRMDNKNMIDMNFLKTEINGLYGENIIREMGEIIHLYQYYDHGGMEWNTSASLDYVPTRKKTNLIKKLIKSEARFMFGRCPEFHLLTCGVEADEVIRRQSDFLKTVMESSRFSDKIIKAARDCFIGKRVAVKVWADGDEGISILFKPSLEFVFETEEDDADKLRKIIFFYNTTDESSRINQRIWRQKFEMVDGKCILNEGIYDGNGKLIESKHKDIDTGLLFIPAYVIINDGLTGDLKGESDVAEIMDNQDIYNRLTSDDIDALRFNMFPQRVAVDASASSLSNMVIAPGALIDLATDPAAGGGEASITTLESQFSYNDRFENTLKRIKGDMYELLSVPNVGIEQLRGVIPSGKSLRTLYWELICRCEEKWAVWEPALKWMVRTVLKMAADTGFCEATDQAYTIKVEHMFPMFEEEESERLNDLKEVEVGVRSKGNYIERWGISDAGSHEVFRMNRENELIDPSAREQSDNIEI